MNAKKALKIAGWSIFALFCVSLTIFGVGAWHLFGDKIQAARSVQKLDEGLYYIEYTGDYGFDAFLANGGASSDAEMGAYIASFLSGGFAKEQPHNEVKQDFGCSTLSIVGDSAQHYMGRNFDWKPCQAIIVHTRPAHGYESYATCNIDFLGFGENWKPEGMQNQYMAIAAIYVPLDGMNAAGLCVADLVCGDEEQTNQDTEKADLTTVSAIRLLLDKAANVGEAITLLEAYDMHSSIGTSHHLAIADAEGQSVVVEWVNNEMIVTETNVVTNHYLSAGEKYGVGNEESHKRYAYLQTAYDTQSQQIQTVDLQELLQSVSYQDITQWSIVYHQDTKAFDFYWQRNYDKAYHFAMN